MSSLGRALTKSLRLALLQCLSSTFSIETRTTIAANALRMKIKMENKYLKMVFAKNKTANEQLQEVLK